MNADQGVGRSRLNKRMADLGLCSRREADDWICGQRAIARATGGRDGKAAGAVLVLPAKPVLWDVGALATCLPAGTWKLSGTVSLSPTDAAVAIGLGSWRFERYKAKKGKAGPKIVWPQGADRVRATAIVEAISLARDLITTPSSDMGPADLAAAAQALAKQHKAKIVVIVGDELLKKNYPMVHAVGRASARAPRLIDLTWGKESDPKVTLVGKGVCFDTGGLNIKGGEGMRQMKKDMGGAANALGLARNTVKIGIMDEKGTLLPQGERGEVVIQGANVVKGYENNPEANASSFVDGWFRTGDVAAHRHQHVPHGPENLHEVALLHPHDHDQMMLAGRHHDLGQQQGS